MKTAMIQIVMGFNDIPIHKTLTGITIGFIVLLLFALALRFTSERGNSIQILERVMMTLIIFILIFGTAAIGFTVAYEG